MLKNSAVCILAYNRVDYIKQLVQFVERTEEKDVYPFYFFVDGGDKNAQVEIAKIVDNSSIKEKACIFRDTNIGCGRNHIEAKVQLFEKYDGLFVLEDDLIISKNFFKVLENLWNWSGRLYNNIGVVQAYQGLVNDREWKMARLMQVTNRNDHWWGYYIPKQTWDIIKGYVLEYYDKCIKDCEYRERKGVKPLTASWKDHADVKFKEGDYIPKFCPGGIFGGSGQDAIMNISVYLSNLERVSTKVNYVKNIGERGINFNKGIYKKFKLDEINLDEFDDVPTEFVAC